MSVIYTPNLRLEIAISVRGMEQREHRGSKGEGREGRGEHRGSIIRQYRGVA